MDIDRISQLEKDFAVHLMECSGRHKAIADKLEGLETKIDGHIKGTVEYREKTLNAQVQTRNMLLYGFLITALAIILGPDQAVKLLSMLKGG